MEPRRREAPRADAALRGDATPVVSLVDWLERDGEELVAALDRLYVPRNDPRWLRRNALVALGNTGRAEHLAARSRRTSTSDDEMLARDGGVGARAARGAGDGRELDARLRPSPAALCARAPQPGRGARRDRRDAAHAARRRRRGAASPAARARRRRPVATSSGSSSTSLPRLRPPRAARCGAPRPGRRRRRAAARRGRSALEVGDGLPALRGDPVRLRQALANLVANASAHRPPGAPVVVAARGRPAAGVEVSVADARRRDRARADQGAIFEAGVRFDDRPGQGLGLAVARAVAEAHGGRLEVASAPGQGATFRLVLPPAPATGLSAELALELASRARATSERIAAGSSTTVSPASASTSERSHSSVL